MFKVSWAKKQDDGSFAVWVSNDKPDTPNSGDEFSVKSNAGKISDVVLVDMIREVIQKEGKYLSLWTVEFASPAPGAVPVHNGRVDHKRKSPGDHRRSVEDARDDEKDAHDSFNSIVDQSQDVPF